ncbi:MAG: hypothetical protein RR623_09370 [Bacilli bacterium]
MGWSKKQYEEYARLIVSDYFNLKIDNFILKERPDIHNEIESIGIEITRAISDREGHAYSLMNKYFGKGYNGGEILDEISKDSKFKGEVENHNGIASISAYKSFDYLKKIDTLRYRIDEKRKKFVEYTHFDRNVLLIHFDTLYFPDDICTILREEIEKGPFDSIFILTYDELFYATKLSMEVIALDQIKVNAIKEKVNAYLDLK